MYRRRKLLQEQTSLPMKMQINIIREGLAHSARPFVITNEISEYPCLIFISENNL